MNLFYGKQNKSSQKNYNELLKITGSLSNLFSESSTPYLHYRIAENVFCKAFEADNLSRSDLSADARKNNFGIGLKTFLNNNGRTFQKIAEFNRKNQDLQSIFKTSKNLNGITEFLAVERNKRLIQTKNAHNIEELIYHCVSRQNQQFLIFEQPMDEISIAKIRNIKKNNNSIIFSDLKNEYLYNISKSTLFKRFITGNATVLPIQIIKDPIKILYKLFEELNFENSQSKKDFDWIILPLYSFKTNEVELKSGLNQWNASGRKRNENEVYIPVPVDIHKTFPDFFPPVGQKFELHLPNKKVLQASMCQTMELKIGNKIINKGKGLMSNPNSDLGAWLLRDILNIEPGQIATKKHLEDQNIDSVEIRKTSHNNYEIDFKNAGSFEEFFEKNIA